MNLSVGGLELNDVMLAKSRPTRSTQDSGMRGFSGFFEGIFSFFSKSGPWAVLSLLLLAWLAYEVDMIVRTAGSQVAEYVLVSTENVKSLAVSMHELQDAETKLASSLVQTQSNVQRNGEQIAVTQEQIKQSGVVLGVTQEQVKVIVEQMQRAFELMEAVPAQREEQTELLKRIDVGIQELRSQVELNGT